MQCRQCKEDVDVGKWKFCPHCGGGLGDEKVINLFRKIFSSKRNIILIISLEVFFILLIVGGFFVYHQRLDQKNKKILEMLEKSKEIVINWESQEKIVPLTYVGENKRLVELKIASPVYGKIRTEVEVLGITKKEVQELSIRPESKVIYLAPDITEEGYSKLEDSHKFQLELKVFQIDDNQKEKELINEKKDVFFFSRNDIIWNDNGTNNSEYIVRLMNKDKAEIGELIRKSADHMIDLGGDSKAMVGYLGDEKEAQRQMQAIFIAIKEDYKIRYVAAPFSYDALNIQRVKAPDEVLKTKSGLCIELSLLMATALESIGINSIIVLTQSHAWVGIENGPMSDKFVFLETTALDKSSTEAVKIAQENWNLVKNTPTYKILKVKELRADGLYPIKF